MSAAQAAARTSDAAAPDLSWFRRRQARTIAALVAIVVLFQLCSLICNFSLGYAVSSIPAAFVWMFQNFVPTVESLANLPMVVEQTISTALDSVAATVIAAVCGIAFSVLGSSSIGVECAPVRGVIRAIASIFRNIPMIAWALLLLLSFKQNEFTGFLALFLTTFGQLMRFFLDTFDEIPTGPVEALRSCGASYWQVVFQAGLPLAVADLMSWMLYMVETNIRSATLIGLLTGTGIGFVFNLYYTSFRYDTAGLVIVVTIVFVLVIEAISNAARRSMI
ncbi:PhnE/PtxC family ABC transporter permease [Collinsella ihumii]|uniref:ABC transporter permease subunit n=1 Tax=Collinsella ihumii TaxID=1720204 RepID=A0AAW7K3X0_9ACTN|nr:ABC transporter permease subunit [Collinsella ihumii]MBM6688856.1 ABC transporter permease subunit [Collinsella tanakaei]MBM6905220.1 ABC transporter permease subunit [Collinsella tanakaei]MCF6412861.1 ABC transporter permease subunit [Collinsella tanakaei]MDN0069606.1 ABC transporter permease subunit [Collinsella ihumii]